MATQTQARVVTFGLGKDNEVRASDIILDWPRVQNLSYTHGVRFVR